MKDQTNMIVIIVAIVCTIGCTLAFAFTQRKPLTIQDPPAVPVAPVAPQEGAVVYANSLPNAGSGPSTGGGAGGPGGGPQQGGVAGAGGNRPSRALGASGR